MSIDRQKRGDSSKSVAKSYRYAFFNFSSRFKSVAKSIILLVGYHITLRSPLVDDEIINLKVDDDIHPLEEEDDKEEGVGGDDKEDEKIDDQKVTSEEDDEQGVDEDEEEEEEFK
ncbi:uncharacterized protein DS421_17g578040 [Arachis hypogaea]|nr:uncharacterized protein DS421_17g578040 [Arachis hypogaea]